MSLGMVPIIVGGDSRASNERRVMSLEQSTQVSMATLERQPPEDLPQGCLEGQRGRETEETWL